MKRHFISATAAAVLLGQLFSLTAMATPQGRQATPLPGAVAETPPEYAFSYGGKNFAILDSETKNSKTYYFVLCDNVYGTHKYDSSPYRNNNTCLAYWEPEDQYNIAYWLNNDFLQNGNGTGNKLPDGIVSYLDYEHEWVTEEIKGLEGYEESPKVSVHPLALLSVTEWRDKYLKKIGQNVSDSWFMRSARSQDTGLTSQILYTGSSQPLGTNTAWRANGSPLGVRPCFYLSEDFFKNCKLEHAGKAVQDMIADVCNTDLYTYDELVSAFSAPVALNVAVQGELVVGETIKAVYNYQGIYPAVQAEYAWYSSDTENGVYTPISGATGETFVLTEAQSDKYIKVSVTPKSESPFVPTGSLTMSETAYGFVYGAAATREALIQIKNAGKDGVLIKTEEYNILLKVNTDYSQLGVTAGLDNFAEILAGMDYETLSEFRVAYSRAAALARLNLEEYKIYIDDRITDEDFNIDISRYEALSDKSYVIDAVYGKNFRAYSDYETTFFKALAVADINDNDRENIKDILLYYNEYFDTDLSAISSYKLGLAATELLKTSYGSFDELNNAVRAAAAAAAAADEPITVANPDKLSKSITRGTNIPSVALRRDYGLKIETEDGEGMMFSDLSDAPWAAESILYLADRGVIDGYDDGTFRPQNTLLREEFVKLAAAAFIQDEADSDKAFSDVSEDAWYAPYIKRASAKGAVEGISDTEFGVGRTVTREDMTVILYRLMPQTEVEGKTDYTDYGQISDYAKEAVAKMSAIGIINGLDDGSFSPKAEATRAMAAKVIYGMFKYLDL